MQKLLAVGVSSVAFLRNAFPKEAFKEGKSLGKIPIRLLKASNPIKEAGNLAKYVLSAMANGRPGLEIFEGASLCHPRQ